MVSCISGSMQCCYLVSLFFFKQKTAYEMRISDWSSDVCSSDLAGDEILVSDSVYRPTRRFCDHVPKRLGVKTIYYDPLIGGAIASLIKIGRASCRERVCQYV